MNRALLFAAALCAVLGAVCAGTPGLRFGAALLLCGGLFLILLAALNRLSETRRWARILRGVCLGLFCAGLALFLAMELQVLSRAAGDAEDAA